MQAWSTFYSVIGTAAVTLMWLLFAATAVSWQFLGAVALAEAKEKNDIKGKLHG
jgi:hypothetical protein